MSNRFRILLIFDHLPELWPGIGAEAWPHLSGLDPEAVELRFAPLADSGPSPASTAFWPQARIERGFLPGGHRNPLNHLRIRQLLGHFEPHCVCAMGTSARLLAMRAADATDVPSRVALVADMGHDLTPSLVGSLRTSNAHATRVVVDSYAAARRLMRQENVARERIDIIPPGIDTTRFPFRTPETVAEAKHTMGLSVHQPVVLLLAPFAKHQDHQTFLEAGRQLIRHQPHVRLVMVGAGPDSAKRALLRTAGELELSEHVMLIPPDDTLPTWLAATDVGVLTSYAESGSPTLLAYMAAGLPIVAANVAGSSELIRHGECGYLVDPKDADQLAMYIMIYLLSGELSERLGNAARVRAQNEFSLANARNAFTDFFHTLAYAHGSSIPR